MVLVTIERWKDGTGATSQTDGGEGVIHPFQRSAEPSQGTQVVDPALRAMRTISEYIEEKLGNDPVTPEVLAEAHSRFSPAPSSGGACFHSSPVGPIGCKLF